ncbi:MAG TPA: NADH:flavin oxidoreductase/NADH oxidase family protein [Bacteriovoracaceae bacterium]|nr:NADH:flavin oxidoreductase/NADH oxidase family protein [Bacteriovoracaceae bacterium]
MKINSPLLLPCGVKLKNRIAKSSMSENMGDPGHTANAKFGRLYKRWSEGGAGLLITGNIMVDSSALGEAFNVVIEEGKTDPFLKAWAVSGTLGGNQLWAQLNHPGKQSPKFLNKSPVAPSAISLKAPLGKLFHTPRELTEVEIRGLIHRYSVAAQVAKSCGFTGVQIHGAHGYLVSQFLSPTHNNRKDAWGGNLENRMRFVLEIYHSIREKVGKEFPVSIKINSADFQKGGFTEEDSLEVVQRLSRAGMDLIEISGGTYETPVMIGSKQKASTSKREAYFLEYCHKVREVVKTPLMLTGGFRTLNGMEAALASGATDVIGLARSMAINPDFPRELLSGNEVVSEVKPLTTGIKTLDNLAPLEIIWYTQQLHRMGKGLEPDKKMSTKLAMLKSFLEMGVEGIKRVRAK